MNKAIIVLVAFMLAVACMAPPATSCGDKFLVRCTASNIQAPGLVKHPGRILILATPDLDSVKWLEKKGAAVALTRAGHTVYLVHNEFELLGVLATTEVDIVVADIVDIESLLGRSVELPGNPMVVPLVDKSQAERVPAIRAEYPYLLKVPGSKGTFMATVLVAVEDAQLVSS